MSIKLCLTLEELKMQNNGALMIKFEVDMWPLRNKTPPEMITSNNKSCKAFEKSKK